MPAHHPESELLMDYASGAAPEPVALLVASHVSLCRDCQAEIARLEALGGALFDELDGAPLGPGAVELALARLEVAEDLKAVPVAASALPAERLLPRPLCNYPGDGLASLRWKGRGRVAEADLLTSYPGIRTRLLRIKSGTAVPRHTHEGFEYTLLLAGGYRDGAGHYSRGDVAVADADVDHRPLADEGEDCLCLVVTDGPLRLTGPIGRYLNFLVNL